MKPIQLFFLLVFFLLMNSCIVEFIPEINEEKEMLVVQGLITDQPETNTIKLSMSRPLGEKSAARPLSGCFVSISDDHGNNYNLTEAFAGSYITDPAIFKGIVGRLYTLKIRTNSSLNNFNFESDPMEMKPVPPIDSLYYVKTVIKEKYENYRGIDGCMIYLDTHDPENNNNYYRWEYSETWVLRLLFPVQNMTCWISDNSKKINIKSTRALKEVSINRHRLNYITNITDRLKTKYSILVNQYSLTEAEYLYWEKLQILTERVGGLYDIIPASIQGNISCIENPDEKVLGYFSVSSKSSERIYIDDEFSGIIDRYDDCITDTIYGDIDPPSLYVSKWVLSDNPPSFPYPRIRILTDKRGCSDCTVRGTIIKPDFWIDEK